VQLPLVGFTQMSKVQKAASELKAFEENYIKSYKRVKLAARVVGFFALLTLIASILALLMGVAGFCVLCFVEGWGWWSWILPLLLCWLPALVGGVFWYALYTIAGVPETMKSIKVRMKEKIPENLKGFVKKHNDGKRKGISSSIKLCWNLFMAVGEVDDVILAGTVIGFAVTPPGWITILIFLAWLITGGITMALLSGLLFYF